MAVAALTALALASGAPGVRADEEVGNLPGGTGLTVSIDDPTDGALIASTAASPVTFTGTASVAEAAPVADTTLVYVLDVSGSTEAGAGGCAGDANGDGNNDSILDCEIAALQALNQAAIAQGTVDEVGVVAFGSAAAIGDASPDAGQQSLVLPAADVNGNTQADVEDVLTSAFAQDGVDGGLTQFTPVSVGFRTNFEAAVQQACGLTQLAGNPNVTVLFLSDGTATAGGNAIDDLPCAPAAATIHTIAAGGTSSCADTGSSGQGSLQQIADATGGTCTEVSDLSTLPGVVPGLIESTLDSIEISLDGGAAVLVATVSAPLPATGPVSVTWSHDLNLAPGIHDVCVTATGSDGGGSDSVTDCHEVTVAEISLSPLSDINDLTFETSHTVTATVSAGPDGGVAGVPVAFDVTSGPNTGAAGVVVTDGNGVAEFTWTNPNQDPSGLGTDDVQGCFTDDLANTQCADAEKVWADLTPPEVDCTASINPSGNQPIGAQPGGVTRSHGYFLLSATDVIDPDPQVFVRDTGSGTVFGPFADGDTIKYTKDSSATPSSSPHGGPNSAVAAHLIGNGDAEVFATDASGNTSDPVSCTVPEPQ